MHFIRELGVERVEFLTESTASGGSKLYIEGPYLMAEDVNRNRRVYSKPILEEAVEVYIQDFINEQRAIGELNHPDYPNANPKEAALITERLDWRGNVVDGKSLILNNPYGTMIRSLLEANFKLGVSSRGLGDTRRHNGVDHVTRYRITAIDAVDKPSAQVAYVKAINESVTYVEQNGIWVQTVDENRLMNNIDMLIEQMKTNKSIK